MLIYLIDSWSKFHNYNSYVTLLQIEILDYHIRDSLTIIEYIILKNNLKNRGASLDCILK